MVRGSRGRKATVNLVRRCRQNLRRSYRFAIEQRFGSIGASSDIVREVLTMAFSVFDVPRS